MIDSKQVDRGYLAVEVVNRQTSRPLVNKLIYTIKGHVLVPVSSYLISPEKAESMAEKCFHPLRRVCNEVEDRTTGLWSRVYGRVVKGSSSEVPRFDSQNYRLSDYISFMEELLLLMCPCWPSNMNWYQVVYGWMGVGHGVALM